MQSKLKSQRVNWRFRITLLFTGVLTLPLSVAEAEGTLESSTHTEWAFRSPQKIAVPQVKSRDRVRNVIDSFILKSLEAQGLVLNLPADRSTLLRRVTLDLTGLPPTVAEQQSFLSDNSPEAYERVVDRLLGSPEFGARWAQHWLDVVRFAETDGFKSDQLRPNAYRYRDYVVDAFNADLPYNRFISQQLAGDEIEPDNPHALVATGLNRLYPDEDNAANLFQRRQEILDDITETTGLAFLGLTMGCAKCHDHKFDSILQEDFFRLQAFFSPIIERDDVQIASMEEREDYARKYQQWEAATAEVRAKIDNLIAAPRQEAATFSLSKFEPAIQECYLTAPEKRSPYQQQIALIAAKQVEKTNAKTLANKLGKEGKQQFEKLSQELDSYEHLKPEPLPTAMSIANLDAGSPPTYLLDGGNWKNPLDEVQPGFPVFLNHAQPAVTHKPRAGTSAGRRTELVEWLTSAEHPLTARVMVNRLWQHHLGRGIVGTPNDFGIQGEPPTHPELLDWLAVELMANDWSLKHIHRLIVTSSTYCQASRIDTSDQSQSLATRVDPNNKLWWHAQRRRLEGEAIRDSMLSVAGQVNLQQRGPSVQPKLPSGVSKRYAWEPNEKLEEQRRRSIYVLVKRNMRFPLFDSFDFPDMFNSCGCRTQSTTPPQALLMLNGDDSLELADVWARELCTTFNGLNASLIEFSYAAALGRPATRLEISHGLQFVEQQMIESNAGDLPASVSDFCHALFNCNEFIYID